jgi:biopolymer transport protein ExbB
MLAAFTTNDRRVTLSLWGLFQQGGWIMWPLLASSLAALAIIIDRTVNLRANRFMPPVVTTRIETLVESRAIGRAMDACREKPGVFPNIILAALDAYHYGRDATREAIEAAGRKEIPRVSRYLAALSTIAGVAPLLGLLGTVLGMIQVFTVVADEGLGQASSLSGGIAVALVTTAFGLMVAIPSLVMYNVFTKKAEGIILDIESRVLALSNRLFLPDGTPIAGDESTTKPAPSSSRSSAAAAEA